MFLKSLFDTKLSSEAKAYLFSWERHIQIQLLKYTTAAQVKPSKYSSWTQVTISHLCHVAKLSVKTYNPCRISWYPAVTNADILHIKPQSHRYFINMEDKRHA